MPSINSISAKLAMLEFSNRYVIPLALWAACLFLSVFSPSVSADKTTRTTISFTPEEQAFLETNPIILVGAEQDWAPVDYTVDGKHIGLSSDYLKLISERTGLKFSYITGWTWEELLSGLIEQRIDLLPAIYWSANRTELMNFTSPYLRLRHYAFIRQSRTDIRSIENLKGKRLAVPRGYSYLGHLEQHYPEIEIFLVDTTIEAIDAVITGQADAIVESTALITHYLKENNIHGLKPAFASDFGINEVHLATRKDLPLLRDIIDKALQELSSEEITQINDRWLNISFPVESGQNSPLFTIDEQVYLNKKQQLKACIDPKWLPYEGFIEGKHSGISSEYLHYFSEQIGIPVSVVKTDSWKESLAFVKQRHCDFLTLASNRPDRRAYLDFTQPYIQTSLALATQGDAWFYSNFSELNGKKIGIIQGYSPGKVLRKRFPSIQLIEYKTIKEGLRAVQEGRVLGFLDAVPTLSYHIQNDFPGDLKISGKFDYDWSVGIAARNDEPLLAKIFDKVILATPESVHNRIRNNWLGVRYEQAVDYSLIWTIISVFGFALLLILMRYRQLHTHRREITDKNRELALINQQLEEQKEAAQHMANHDMLTGLPNRSQLLNTLDHAVQIATRQQSKVAVLFLDLDRFKYINDSLGHHIGDELLREVSQRLARRVRSSDTLARIGGDEFIIVLESFSNDQAPATIAQDIIDSIKDPISVMGHKLNISVSIGIALFPRDSDDIHMLIKHADIAMYRAKELGRNRFRYYTQTLSERTEKRLKTEAALREAMGNHQFSLYYQPITHIETGKVTRAEALIRWHHPELGMVPPDYFIPIAEENGLIHEIGLWVMTEACRQFKRWEAEQLGIRSISINVSSIQFQQGDLISRFAAILSQEQVDAHSIGIEITEHYLMDQTERNIAYLTDLKDAGHNILVDDFGVGYSSMSYMKRLPLDIIKIDRSFISDIPADKNDIQITQAIIALTHSLGYGSVAEGVENTEQLAFLQQIGCDYAQGYYFSRPLPPKEFALRVVELNQPESPAPSQ
ncbi:EAL domain-containing protein [uncultured Neptuniibacter sp.]|uniref:EAL domain-containing protein n=1 Tax=uncultured Neptuniibacter sp. TaxID=502143 RepID=UPI00262CE012|nr:EAL domain-containing protein [uncultured Neptuniibacter sp.]